jgi:hypothetical protein
LDLIGKSNNLIWSSFHCKKITSEFTFSSEKKVKKQTWLCISLLHHHYLYSYVKPLVKLLKRLLDFKPLLFIPRQALYIAAEKKSTTMRPPPKKEPVVSQVWFAPTRAPAPRCDPRAPSRLDQTNFRLFYQPLRAANWKSPGRASCVWE